VELDALQDLFYADRRFKLLVVLQGTDTAGKDGTIRGVFSRTSALGVHTVGWKAPTEPERAHDYLWRIHQQVPGAGEFMVFNRSHYEDVLVPVVNGWITPEQTRRATPTSTTSSAAERDRHGDHEVHAAHQL
jgi:polyphosphate kinase 2 (PPK2 family)